MALLCEFLINNVTDGADEDGTVLVCEVDPTNNNLTCAKGTGTITGKNHPTATGTGLTFDPADGPAIANSGTGQSVAATLDTLDKFSLIVVADLQDSAGSGSFPTLLDTAFGFGRDTSPNQGSQFCLGSRSGNGRYYGSVNRSDAGGNAQEHQRWNGTFNSPAVMILNVDLSLAGTAKLALFRDNVLVTATSQSPSGATAFHDPGSLRLCIGGLINDVADRGWEGDVFYAAMLDEVLDSTQRADIQTALDSNVNVSPFAGPGDDIAGDGHTLTSGQATLVNDVAGSGSSLTSGQGSNFIQFTGAGHTLTAGIGTRADSLAGSGSTLTGGQGSPQTNIGTAAGSTLTGGDGVLSTPFAGAGSTLTKGVGSATESLAGTGSTLTGGQGTMRHDIGTAAGSTLTGGVATREAVDRTGSGSTLTSGQGSLQTPLTGAGHTLILGEATLGASGILTGLGSTLTGGQAERRNDFAGLGSTLTSGQGISSADFEGSGSTRTAGAGTRDLEFAGTGSTLTNGQGAIDSEPFSGLGSTLTSGAGAQQVGALPIAGFVPWQVRSRNKLFQVRRGKVGHG